MAQSSEATSLGPGVIDFMRWVSDEATSLYPNDRSCILLLLSIPSHDVVAVHNPSSGWRIDGYQNLQNTLAVIFDKDNLSFCPVLMFMGGQRFWSQCSGFEFINGLNSLPR